MYPSPYFNNCQHFAHCVLSHMLCHWEKDLHDADNHDGVITDLEPDILECEVKWALERITMNKASGGDGLSD